MLLGLAIGDALGNTSEGMTAADRSTSFGEIREYQRHPRFGDRRGYPSDDTQLAFWTLEQMIADGAFVPDRVLDAFTRREIFGIGRTVRQALFNRRAGADWCECGVQSAGNGALMRIAPILVPHLRNPTPELWADAALCSMLTHNDSASIASCVAFSYLLWELLRMDKLPDPQWWPDTFCPVLRQIETADLYEVSSPTTPHARCTLSDLLEKEVLSGEPEHPSGTPATTGTQARTFFRQCFAPLYILMRHAHDPEEAIARAVNDTWDNDTIAVIVGAAVGALHGEAALPERWRRGLSGRTQADDEGRITALLDEAGRLFWQT
jgi:ADP-ribosylglycohydrolase